MNGINLSGKFQRRKCKTIAKRKMWKNEQIFFGYKIFVRARNIRRVEKLLDN